MADEENEQGALAACAARRWLARNAADVKLVRTHSGSDAVACTSLVSCLPALQDITLHVTGINVEEDLGCLLEALAWCPHLRALDLSTALLDTTYEIDTCWPFPDAAAFAKLRSLTKLAFSFREDGQFCLADVVSALVPLTGLAELSLMSNEEGPTLSEFAPDQLAVVPAALGHLKGLQSLSFTSFSSFDLEAGCLNLPNLLSLEFEKCNFKEDANMLLPGITALECVTRIALKHIDVPGTEGSCVLNPELVRLPYLHTLVLSHVHIVCDDVSSVDCIGLPAGMGLLSLSLLHLNVSWLVLPHFPLDLTQLVALESLDASHNNFAELPLGITALSKLTDLSLGRVPVINLMHGQCDADPLDVRALGDLSGFPALRELTFKHCEVMLCPSLLGALRHASLDNLCFKTAYPAPKCALAVLQLCREFRRLRRGSAVTCVCEGPPDMPWELRAAWLKFKADINACGQ